MTHGAADEIEMLPAGVHEVIDLVVLSAKDGDGLSVSVSAVDNSTSSRDCIQEGVSALICGVAESLLIL